MYGQGQNTSVNCFGIRSDCGNGKVYSVNFRDSA